MVEVKAPKVLNWQQATRTWYQWVLFAIMLSTAAIGLLYVFYSAVTRIIKYYRTRPRPDIVSTRIATFLQATEHQLERKEKPKAAKVSSFGIYLGDFATPPTPEQEDLLQRYNFTILDPFQEGVREAVDNASRDRQYFGRVDLEDIAADDASKDDALERLVESIVRSFNHTQLNGIVLAGVVEKFSPAYLGALLNFLDHFGLAVYLEVSPPKFLPHCSMVSHPAIYGLVVRNAVILPTGEHRDYFDMQSLQPTLQAFVKESCLRTFNALSLEIYKEGADVSNAVLKRGIQWTGFYSAITWAGTDAAVFDAELSVPTVEPLGAFEWLKEENVMKVHSDWRENMTISRHRNSESTDAWSQIAQLFPYTEGFLASHNLIRRDSFGDMSSTASTKRISVPSPSSTCNASMVESYREYKGLGCYPLGVDVSPLAFAEVVQAQLRLKKMKLLHPVDQQKLSTMGLLYRRFLDRYLIVAYPHANDIQAKVKDLSIMAQTGRLRVHIGLNPGLRYGQQARFWGVYHAEEDKFDVFVSKDIQGIAGTVLHCYLSAKGFTREKCFEIETALALWSEDAAPCALPRRLVQDVDLLTPKERLLLLQQMKLNESHGLVVEKITALVCEKLIDAPTRVQLGEMDSVGYLNGAVTPRELLEARFEQYRDQNVHIPNLELSLAFFRSVETAMIIMLRDRRDDQLKQLASALKTLLVQGRIDAWADLLGLGVFCAARKAAFDEVYLEVTDRNPLFNDQPDQAAAFAESFALGSRCEAYFDVAPGTFGKMLSDRFRAHYVHKQPPSWANGAPDFATAYGGAGIDIDPNGPSKGLPQFQRFTFLSVFAIPALIDIVLLTTTGRGLYLSSYMHQDQAYAATIALMISLLLSGATGTWIACGGSYYLVSMAFSAMNVFVLTRVFAGLAFTFIGAAIGFGVICGIQGFPPAIVFALYLIAFTSYLILFAALAIFQFPGSAFLSGRKLIMVCLPPLLISPIITMWTQHVVVVYLLVFYAVLFSLFIALRRIGSKWVTWYQKIKRTDDSEIRKWYTTVKCAGDPKVLGAMTDPAALKVSREALLKDIVAETRRGRFTKPTEDKLVRELAADYEATNFLLDWYCRYSDVPRPIPYSSAWNIQTKVALQTLCDAQKGIRLHSAFIHWRQAGDEVGCGILYFVVALLDKWIDMVTGIPTLGLGAGADSDFHVAVGFGLAYYLVGAVLIDVKAQALHAAVAQSTPIGVETLASARKHAAREVEARRKTYITTLLKYLAWHSWSMAFATLFVFFLGGRLDDMIMFLAYVGAYTGLLWYQYTKIFAGPHAFKPLLVAFAVGLSLGVALRLTKPNFIFSSVIGLGTGTWLAALLCLRHAKLGKSKAIDSGVKEGERFHAHVKPWADPEYSQEELKAVFDKLDMVPDEARFTVLHNQHPGVEIVDILQTYRSQGDIGQAFPDVDELVNIALKAWETGQIEIELVALSRIGADLRAISRWTDGTVKLVIGVGRGAELPVNIRSNCRIVAEALLHEVAEGYFQVSHEHAVLAESLISDTLPQNLKNLLSEENNYENVLDWAKREMLKQQCLGIECDLQWDKLPKYMRSLFLKRSLGESCEVTQREYDWLARFLQLESTDDFLVHIARCDLALEAAANAMDHAFTEMSSTSNGITPAIQEVENPTPTSVWYHLKMPFSFVYHLVGTFIKFFVIALVADAEFQRELDFKMRSQPFILRAPMIFSLNLLWTYARMVQNFGLSMFLFHGRESVKQLWKETKGMTITLKSSRLLVQGKDGESTAFLQPIPTGGYKLFHYKGIHKFEPRKDVQLLKYVTTYTDASVLTEKTDYRNGEITNTFEYDYDTPEKSTWGQTDRQIPTARRCVSGPRYLEQVKYNNKGLVESGSYMLHDNLVYFKLFYRKNARHLDELLRGEFTLAHLSCVIEWCAPPRRNPEKRDRWIPYSKVLAATFIEGTNTYVSKWSYDHKFHPKITSSLNGEPVASPPMIENDWLAILKKPTHDTFFDENPFFHSTWLNSNALARWLGLSTQTVPISTSVARSRIWKAWKKSKDVDGVIVRYMDERLMRRDKVLGPYWQHRNHGHLESAKKYLKMRADAIMASADLDDEISSWTPLAIKMNDLSGFGSGGDSIMHTKSQDVGIDDDNTLHVLASDNGTWPNEGGGVSACRRDMVNSLKSIKWHMLCESATDFGLPKHQTEQNVLSLKIVPLWGLDFLNPNHGLFKNRLDSEVDMIRTEATDLDIQREFIPTLSALVKGARAIHLTNADLQQATRALINLNDYFTDKRHWSQVWKSDVSKEAWTSLWLSQDMPNTKPSSEWLDTELPTLSHLETAMELWLRYLFVFSMKVPEKVPAVFQASHHSCSAAYGVICKVKRGCQLQIWDHAIAWRETNMCMSSTLCKLPPFVRNSLLGLMRLTSVIILHHADVILPCADFFNPGWEVEIGSCQGTIEHRNSFKRKIAPVVNGITDDSKFKPVKEILTKRPTVTMLSHLWFCKDLKTAILAADIIVNEWGFKDYQLDIYGSIEKAPIYSNECQELIASKSLRGQVKLCGSSDPMKVLEQTWLFLNSSLSEGLPLALGEAALTGAPVVCTDVGASLRVLSDPDDFSRYSGVVAPNDARALAKAQIKILGMLDEWGKFAEDDGPSPEMPFAPTAEDVERITARMYEKSEHRRKLGLMSRGIVQKSFGGDRYLREHEQMLWIGKSHRLMEGRILGEISENPKEITQELELDAPIRDEAFPRSAAPSWRSPSPVSFASRPTSPAFLADAPRSASLLSEAMRSVSRLSNATTAADGLSPLSASFQLSPLSGPGSGYSTPIKRPYATRLSDFNHRSRESLYFDIGAIHHSPYESPRLHATKELLKPPKRPELRYRNSDVSVINLENVGRYLAPLS